MSIITLKYEGKCMDCGSVLAVGAEARWYGRGRIYCVNGHNGNSSTSRPINQRTESTTEEVVPEKPESTLAFGGRFKIRIMDYGRFGEKGFKIGSLIPFLKRQGWTVTKEGTSYTYMVPPDHGIESWKRGKAIQFFVTYPLLEECQTAIEECTVAFEMDGKKRYSAVTVMSPEGLPWQVNIAHDEQYGIVGLPFGARSFQPGNKYGEIQFSRTNQEGA